MTFIKAQPFGEDGHLLFSDAGASVWEPVVDEFLRPQGLEAAKAPLAAPALPQIAAPAGLRANGQAAFRSYLAAAPHKAFAMTPAGAFGWRSDEEAVEAALASCTANAPSGCKVVMVNDLPAAK